VTRVRSGPARVLAAAALVATAPRCSPAALSSVRLTAGLARPDFAASPPGDDQRLFVLEQHSGRIRIVRLADGSIDATDFLTIGGLATGTEQGLLGLAFHPAYASNGFFYVNVTVASGATEIRRYHVSADPDVADPASATLVLGWAQPQASHNGGWLGFGPDGYLYVAVGDGGGANDSDTGHTDGTGNAQDVTDNLLGKLLRIDVDGDDFPADDTRNYAIPPSNPFVGMTGDDEIWSFGLRNPWRSSFDRATGDLYIADVGQDAREEIDVQPAGAGGGQNYGWRLREGTIATPTGGVGGARPPGAIDPIYDYPHGTGAFQGDSVTGGYVYRGPIAEIQGQYFFGDFVSERIWSLVWDGSDPTTFDGTNFTSLIDRTAELTPDVGAINQISSFAEDDAGNLYILDLGGEIFRITSAEPTTTSTSVSTTTSSASSTSSSTTTSPTSSSTSTSVSGTSTTTSTTLPGSATFPPTRKLVVKQGGGGQRLRLVVKDASIQPAMPCDVDGELIVEAVGAGGPVRHFPLAADLWRPIHRPRPERGCRYRRGPVARLVRLKTGKSLVVVAKGDDLGVPLATDPRPVRIEVRQGDQRYCVELGGATARYVPGRRLVATRADPAAACPDEPAVAPAHP
jgi:glucose/arabinose dehydrogenase